MDQSGRRLAATEGAWQEPLPDADREAVLESRTHHVVDIRASPRGGVFENNRAASLNNHLPAFNACR